VDQTSRNVQIRALFDNTDRKLLPGMYVQVAVDVGQATRYVTLPQTAIVYNPYGNSVFVAVKGETSAKDSTKDGLVARQTFVKTGATRGDQVAVISGVEQGATVVTAGQIKLRNGTLLKIDNSVQVSNDPSPIPIDQ
jgi:membrane fusion protein (multidrug efflux system)